MQPETPPLPSAPWATPVPPLQAEQLIATVNTIAAKCAKDDMQQHIRLLSDSFWHPTALTAGYPSLSLLFLTLFTYDHDIQWLKYAAHYLSLTGNATQETPLGDLSLSKGISGLAFLLGGMARIPEAPPIVAEQYQRLDKHLCKQILAANWTHPTYKVLSYDVISGAAGILACLLVDPMNTPLKQQAIEFLLEHLIAFLDPGSSSWFDHWAIPVLSGPNAGTWAVNCGLAHGIPGPLAAVALARMAGYDLAGQRTTIERAATWLCYQTVKVPWGIDWPDWIATPTDPDLQPARSAWCYGAPGILRALSLAGRALADTSITTMVEAGLLSLINRPSQTRNIDTLTVCHGNSGLLLILLHFWQETRFPELVPIICEIVRAILGEFDEASPMGFVYHFHGQAIASPGLLYGAVGTALVLLSAATDTAPWWSRLLCIA